MSAAFEANFDGFSSLLLAVYLEFINRIEEWSLFYEFNYWHKILPEAQGFQ
ncbi:hypothetical protein [Flavobacterium sp. ZS1P14]|uniref:hypothetical protein n=1 Tax=Flavobacterium sp. ZS1P14 TaxID=3401729 RepID=UPI003AACECAB